MCWPHQHRQAGWTSACKGFWTSPGRTAFRWCLPSASRSLDRSVLCSQGCSAHLGRYHIAVISLGHAGAEEQREGGWQAPPGLSCSLLLLLRYQAPPPPPPGSPLHLQACRLCRSLTSTTSLFFLCHLHRPHIHIKQSIPRSAAHLLWRLFVSERMPHTAFWVPNDQPALHSMPVL